MPKFTVVKLIDQKKTVPMRLLPEESGNKFTWQIGDTDVLEYDRATKQFTCEIYEFQNDDYELVKTLSHEDSYQVALDEGIIYE